MFPGAFWRIKAGKIPHNVHFRYFSRLLVTVPGGSWAGDHIGVCYVAQNWAGNVDPDPSANYFVPQGEKDEYGRRIDREV